jgi:hypothetical protein
MGPGIGAAGGPGGGGSRRRAPSANAARARERTERVQYEPNLTSRRPTEDVRARPRGWSHSPCPPVSGPCESESVDVGTWFALLRTASPRDAEQTTLGVAH